MPLTLNTNSLTIPTVETSAVAAPDIGAYEFISEIVSTDASTVDFSNVFTTTYDVYKMTCTNVGGSVNGTSYKALYESGGSFTDFNYYARVNATNPPVFAYGSGNAFTINQNNSGSDAQRMNFTITIYNPLSTNAKHAVFNGSGYSGFSGIPVNKIDAVLQAYTTNDVTGIQIKPNSGTIQGTYRLYGLSKT
tara:strand:- start:257 stop:832 length:576 start_codon:yes stop_codon:yes gene_type:complete